MSNKFQSFFMDIKLKSSFTTITTELNVYIFIKTSGVQLFKFAQFYSPSRRCWARRTPMTHSRMMLLSNGRQMSILPSATVSHSLIYRFSSPFSFNSHLLCDLIVVAREWTRMYAKLTWRLVCVLFYACDFCQMIRWYDHSHSTRRLRMAPIALLLSHLSLVCCTHIHTPRRIL